MDLAELLKLPRVREECVLRSAVGFMALHGGSQDRGTDQIASRAAEQAGASYYAIIQPARLRVHLTSRRNNPDHSAMFRAFLQHVDIAISVHGFGRDSFALWIDPVNAAACAAEHRRHHKVAVGGRRSGDVHAKDR